MDATAQDDSQHPVKRRRLRKACIPCRQRKRKCDYFHPCEMCTKHGYACQYDPNPGSTASLLERSNSWNQPEPAQGGRSRSAHASSSIDDRSLHTPDPGSHRSLRSQSPPSPGIEHGILDSSKTRYVGATSVVAFPRTLAQELQSKSLPSLHSFGWNFGIRPEEISGRHSSLERLITQSDLHLYCTKYFTILEPVFAIIDKQTFNDRCREYFRNPDQNVLYGAIVAGVVALGSFFTVRRGHKHEAEIIQWAKHVLEDPQFTRRPSVDMVAGWVLRTIYLRATTRPNCAWLASSTTMHLVEATGLHRDPKTVVLVSNDSNGSGTGGSPDARDMELRRRIFWIAWVLNTVMSYEYGRSAVTLPYITCQPINPDPGTHSHILVAVARTIPTLNAVRSSSSDAPSPRKSLCASISAASAIEVNHHPFMALTKTDLCLCFYRHLRQRQISIPPEIIEQIIAVGREALDAASQLAKDHCLWWNVLGSIFQLVCVCISLNNQSSLALLGPAIRVLDDIVRIADTPLAQEALTMARHLVEAATSKKKRELTCLENASTANIQANESVTHHPYPPSNNTASTMPVHENADFTLDHFLGDWDPAGAGFGDPNGGGGAMFLAEDWAGQHTMPMPEVYNMLHM